MDGTTVGPTRPATAQRRSLAPDLARGLMLAPIAVANVMIYLHARPYGLRQHIVEDSSVDRAVTAILVTFVDGRAYPLFAALLGYGLVKIAASQRARGLDDAAVAAVLRRRSWWLLALGCAHAVLAFSGDVLGLYGLVGLVLASRLRMAGRTLLLTAAIWLVVASAVQALTYSEPEVRDQRSFLWSYAISDAIVAGLWRPLEWVMTPVGLAAAVSSVLVGVWAARRGILDHPGDHRRLLRSTAGLGITVGVLGGVGMALATVRVWQPPYPVVFLLSWTHIATGVLCGLGYASGIGLWTTGLERRHPVRLPAVIDALSAAGQRSLTCYLAQTLVFAVLLPAWSLGWGATLGTADAAALALVTWAGTVVGAALLQRAGFAGPTEVLLRRLTYRRPAPMRAKLD